ncbi:MAG: hypothetical protein Fur0023_11000 [Bacteroidia bacterium]
MKKKKQTSKMLTEIEKAGKILLISGTLVISNVQESKGQWNVIGNAGRTNNFPVNIAKIGIGFFPTAPSIQAKLHINQFLLAPDPSTNGLLFRTDGNTAQDNMWQIFTGTSATSQTEKFRLFIPANSNNVTLNTVQNANMTFSTNNTPRLQIDSTGKVKIFNLKCNNCFVMSNENGELTVMQAESIYQKLKEQENKINALEREITELSKAYKLLCNHYCPK